MKAAMVSRWVEVFLLNGNMISDNGARYLMTALQANNSLKYLGLQGSNLTSFVRDHNITNSFNPLSPDGAYLMDLACASDRAVGIQLATLDYASPSGKPLMRNIKLSGRNVSSCREEGWPEQ
eukprot:gene2397-8706_t